MKKWGCLFYGIACLAEELTEFSVQEPDIFELQRLCGNSFPGNPISIGSFEKEWPVAIIDNITNKQTQKDPCASEQ